MDKKGILEWEKLGKWILGLVLFLILLGIIMALTGRGWELLDKLEEILKIGF